MATLTAEGLTLIEIVKRQHNNDMLTIAETLAEENEILQDIPWVEANDIFENVSLRRASLPSGTWRKLNAGTAAEKSDTVQVRDSVGQLESWGVHDAKVIDAAASPKQARMDEATGTMQGLSQTMATTLIYGNTHTTPEQFTGLAPRMPDIAAAANVINEGGTGSDLTSIYVVNWGVRTVHGLYPRNSPAGLVHTNWGKRPWDMGSGTQMSAYVDQYEWAGGLAVKDAKSIGRLANIETTGVSNIFDEDNLITLMNRMNLGAGARIYCNDTVQTQMEIRLKDKTNIHFSKVDGLAPGPVLTFKGVQIRTVDKILNTEAALT